MQDTPTHPLTTKPKSLLLILVFALLANFTAPASAAGARGRQITGTITKVDIPAHEFEMLQEDTGTTVSFIWNKHTSFLASSQFTDASVLRKGARITVIRHAPFFGKPFVTKVTLQTAHNPNRKTK